MTNQPEGQHLVREEAVEAMKQAMLDPKGAIAALPKEERDAYEAAQRSIVEARRSANRIEGKIWIV